jgi:hypothetical protein
MELRLPLTPTASTSTIVGFLLIVTRAVARGTALG